MKKLAEGYKRFQHNTEALYATDVPFKWSNRASGNYPESKMYFSEKHKTDGYKTEISVVANGLAINCTDHYSGSFSYLTFFRDNKNFHNMATQKLAQKQKLSNLNDNKEEMACERWAVLVEKEYQGGSDVACILLSVRKSPNGCLSLIEKEQNLEISRERIIVENYIGRLKCLWKKMCSKYIWDESFFDVLFGIFVCLTNFHIMKHPLRSEDNQKLIQMENLVHYLSESKRRRKAEQQASYRKRKRARLSGASVVVRRDDDIDE